MNILCLTDAFWPDFVGGTSKCLVPEVEGLADQGHQLTVVSRRLQPDRPKHEVKPGYDWYRYAGPADGSIFHWLYPFSNYISLPPLLRSLDQSCPFDVAYVHNPFQAAGLRRSLPELRYVYNYHASMASEIELDATKGKYGRLGPLSGPDQPLGRLGRA